MSYPEDPDMVFLSAKTDEGVPVKAAARVKVGAHKIRVQISVWETEDGEHVDAPRLSKAASEAVKNYVLDKTKA